MKKKKILFVCFADSTHSQSWINLLPEDVFDVRVFASPVKYKDMYPPIPWSRPTYTLYQPTKSRKAKRVFWLFPQYLNSSFETQKIDSKNRVLTQLWLRRIIKWWKPEIIHSLSINFGGYLTWKALKKIPKTERPQWVISSWGTEMNYGVEREGTRAKIITFMQECDWFMGDCFRDISHARSLGLPENKLFFDHPLPGAGGVDLEEARGLRKDIKDRKIILIPKAYDNETNKTLPLLEALRLCEDRLDDYKVYLLMSSPEVQAYIKSFSPRLKEKCVCLPTIPKKEFIAMLGSARIMIAPSISDGTPNVMLEAMAMGALPIMSPLSSIQEWIKNGENGLLAQASNPDQLCTVLIQGLTDDELFCNAAIRNQEIISARANRKMIQIEVVDFYQHISI